MPARHRLAFHCSLIAAAAALAGCQSMPEMPFMGKKEAPAEGGTASGAAPAAAAPAILPEPPMAPPPANRTALLTTSFTMDGAVLPTMRGQQLVETRADMRRTDAVHSFDNRFLRAMGGDGRSAHIVRLDKNLLWTLNLAKQTYTECPLTGCRSAGQPPRDKPQPERPEKDTEPSCPLTLKKNELKATPTGERKAINGFNTERIQVSWVMELEDNQGRRNSNRVLLDLWTTPETGVIKDVQAIDQAFAKRYAAALQSGDNPLGRYVPGEVMNSMSALMGRIGPNAKATAATWANEFKKVRGYPIMTTLSWSADGNACGGASASAGGGAPVGGGLGAMMNSLMGGKPSDGGSGGPMLSYTHEVKSIDIKPVSDQWFVPSPGFQKTP